MYYFHHAPTVKLINSKTTSHSHFYSILEHDYFLAILEGV
jgi:hypothetical protein